MFQQLQDTAEALSQRLEMLSVDAPAPPLAPADSRPLPMHQRRPHRVDPGQVNTKRSARFGVPGDAAAAAFAPPFPEADALPGPAGSPDAPGVTHPPLPRSGTLLDRPPASPTGPFQPRGVYALPGEDGSSTRGRGRGWGLVVAAFVLGLAGGCVLYRLVAPGTSPGPPSPTAGQVTDAGAPFPRVPMDPTAAARATVLVNQALRAEKRGDIPRATDLFTEAGKVCPSFPGIHYRLALLSLRQGETNKARTLLARSLAAGEEVAAVHQLRSALARLENQPELGFAELEDATRAEPFNPRYPYYWAEALRRAGRLPEALEKLEDAVARSNDPSEESLYRLKLRLVKIELNQEDEFAGDFPTLTPEAAPATPEWLLTAAALDLKRADYASAAAHLARARQILPPATAAFLFHDQTFLDHAWRPELAPFYAPASDRVASAAPGSAAGSTPEGTPAAPPGVLPKPSPTSATVAPGVRSRPRAP